MNNRRFKSLILITAIVLLSTYLRIYRLGDIPYGIIPDEAMRGYDSYSILRTGADSFGVRFPLFLRGFEDYTPALYSYLSVPFMAIFGLSVFSARLASAFIGVFAVALTYQITRRPFGQTAAFVGSFLLAISPWHILASRTGTEWNLLALGPVLTIALAYRGLRRPYTLIGSGIAGGISLYGYAPIKAFLPILMAGFVIFYWRRLYQLKKFTLIALGLFIVFALPVYLFSFTSEGMQRFNIVFEGGQSSYLNIAIHLIRNYFSYFSPNFFILSQYADNTLPIYIAHLKSVGLLSWIELALIIFGIVIVLFSKKKEGWFILFWLIVSPIGVNLHSNSPWPTLWLAAIPVPHTLAGAGMAGLVLIAKNGWLQLRLGLAPQPILRSISTILIVSASIGILRNLYVMHNDLFYEYPIYGAKDGRKEPIQLLESLKGQYDKVIIPSDSLSTSIYLLFYTQYDPAQRHADLSEMPEQTWQNIDGYSIGQIENYVHQPGCHLILTTVAHSVLIKPQFPQLIPIREFYLPTGEPNVGLYAVPSPLPDITESGTVFGDKIMLQGFAMTSTSNSLTNLQPGDSVCVVLQWQALNDVGADHTVFTHLIGSDHSSTPSLQTQHDGPPLHGMSPTSTWHTGDIVQDIHRLTIPKDTPPGKYHIHLGIYNALTGERLLTNLMEDQLILSELEIKAK